jgi:hypothetical protein
MDKPDASTLTMQALINRLAEEGKYEPALRWLVDPELLKAFLAALPSCPSDERIDAEALTRWSRYLAHLWEDYPEAN